MAEAPKPMKPSVIAISSHVGRGSVGNRAAVFALETLGFPVWSVPTVLLPWHPGHGPSTRIVPDGDQFDAFLADLAGAPWLGEVGAVLTGYLGDAAQADAIARLVSALKARNPEAIYVCDPVIGDTGGLYVLGENAAAIRDRLVPLADIVTPNLFELQWLAGTAGDTADLARHLAPPNVLVTSAFSGGETGNLLLADGDRHAVRHPAIDRPPHGLGDLTAALFLAHRLDGAGEGQALLATTCSVFTLLKRSVARSADELTLESDADCLTAPPLDLELERGPRQKSSRPTQLGG